MGNRLNNALVGMFVIVFGAAWLAITLWLALADLATSYTTYRVYLDESVSGLYLDAPVKYRGVDVGKVTGIDLNPAVPDQVQLTLDVVRQFRTRCSLPWTWCPIRRFAKIPRPNWPYRG